jgi:MFS family permease
MNSYSAAKKERLVHCHTRVRKLTAPTTLASARSPRAPHLAIEAVRLDAVSTSGGPLGVEFRKLFAAATISDLGDGITAAAVPLLATTLTDDPRAIGFLVGATTLPWLVFTLFSGAIVDRVDRRVLMWRVDLARAALVAVIAVLVATEHATIPTLAVALFFLGVGETLFDNAAVAFLPAVVDRTHLNRANGRLQAIGTVCNALAGPPLGAFLFAASTTLPFATDAVSFAVSALLIARIRPGDTTPAPLPSIEPDPARRSILRDIGEGLRFLAGHRLLRRLAGALGVWNLVANANAAMIVLLATRRFDLDERGFGLLLAVTAIGGVAGGALADRIIGGLGPKRSVRVALVISASGYLAVAIAPHLAVLALAFAVEGFAGTVWNVWTLTLRQELVPDRLLGRVTSAYRLVGVGTLPIGAVLGGFLVREFGLLSTYWLAGVAIGGLAIFAFAGYLDRDAVSSSNSP